MKLVLILLFYWDFHSPQNNTEHFLLLPSVLLLLLLFYWDLHLQNNREHFLLLAFCCCCCCSWYWDLHSQTTREYFLECWCWWCYFWSSSLSHPLSRHQGHNNLQLLNHTAKVWLQELAYTLLLVTEQWLQNRLSESVAVQDWRNLAWSVVWAIGTHPSNNTKWWHRVV